MIRLILLVLLVFALSPLVARAQAPGAQPQSTPAQATQAQAGHEYSPLVEKTVNYKNWTLNDLKDNKAVDLRSLMQGKKLVMVVYFAPWCPNWRNEAPVAATEARDARDKTPHYGYRQLTGDTRKWGSPWNIFLDPAACAKDGDVLTEKGWIVNGELIEADVDKFIDDRLKTATAAIVPCKN